MFIGVLSVCTLVSFSRSLPSNYEKPIKCVSVTNIPCQARPALDENLIKHSNKTLFYAFIASINKFGGSCNTIDDQYARVCVPNKMKNMNVKVFNLISRVDETGFLVRRCGLNESVCISK